MCVLSHSSPQLENHPNTDAIATANAAEIGATIPGVMLSAKARDPAPIAIAIFATALLVIAARIGRTPDGADTVPRID
jgi:hypothetical protein